MLYSPLDEKKRQIRLLRLLAGDDHNQINCNFDVASLDDEPRYEALSYVWGDREDTLEILFETERTSITRNLHEALRSLRFRDRERVLWADALCINQEDITERNNQVSQMAAIYEQAECVVCYLGDAWDGSELAMEAIKQLSENKDMHLSSSKSPGLNVRTMGFESPILIMYLFRFFSLPWWSRVWTVQEYILAKRAVFQCGGHIISGDSVLTFLPNMSDHLHSCCFDIGQLCVRLLPQRGSNMSLQNMLSVSLDGLQSYKSCIGGRPSFFFTLSLFRNRKCQDVRDKVFGMLGLVDHVFKDILVKPDYSYTIEQVFVFAALADYPMTKRLDFLSYCYGKRSLKLPSWVPDWSAAVNMPYKRLRWASNIIYYNASRDWETEEVSLGPLRIGIQGVNVDVIIECSRVLDSYANSDAIEELCNIAGVEASETYTYAGTNQSIKQAFELTLLGGLAPAYTEAPEAVHKGNLRLRWKGYQRIKKIDDAPYFTAWEMRMKEKDPREADLPVATMYNLFESIAYDRRFIKTSKGLIGFAPSTCQAGDRVVVLGGGRVPYVLRETRVQDSHRKCYTFLGDAYVHGIMDGEAVAGIGADHEKRETFTLL